MSKTAFILVCFLCVLLFALSVPQQTFAHGDEPRLEINVERINLGGVAEVRGVDFEPEEAITLMLVNSGTAIPLGETTADIEGIFLQIVEIPVDLPEGTYNFLAITDDHNISSPEMLVQGPPVLTEGEGGQGLRDEDDPLLASMPTFAPGVVPGGVSQPIVQPASEQKPVSNRNFTLLIVFAFVATCLLVLVTSRILRKN